MSREHQRRHFEEFRAHTLFKHGVLRRYATAWIQILGRKHAELWIVDGFAGPGKDDTGAEGSPRLLARAAAELQSETASVRLIAIEPDSRWFAALQKNLAAFDAERAGSVPVAYLRRGTCEGVADEIFAMVGTDSPAFFFLDPFGSDGLALNVVERALALEKGEVFALFSQTAVVRHLGMLEALSPTDRIRREAAAAGPTLFPDLATEWLEADLQAAARVDGSFIPTRVAAERVLTELFGSLGAARELLDLPAGPRAEAVVAQYMALLTERGARYIYPIAVYDEDARCVHYLLHAAKHPLAHMKMKEAVQSTINQQTMPDGMRHQLRWAHAAPEEELVNQIRSRFAGETVRWSEDHGVGAGCVRGFALAETRFIPPQAKRLQELLAPWRVSLRPLAYFFPSQAEAGNATG